MTETSWKDKIALAAVKLFPDAIGSTPYIGSAARELIESLGYDLRVASGYFSSILKVESQKVNRAFDEDAIGLYGGLAYQKSGSKESNFIVSRAVAAYLNSITDTTKTPLSLKGLVIALLHERTWQCMDSKELYDAYTMMPLHEGISAITMRLQLIVSLAIEIRQSILGAIAKFEPAAKLFESSNMGLSIKVMIDQSRVNDVYDERDQAECIELSTNPTLLTERYVELFSSTGRARMHYIPYLKPYEIPKKDAPPMLKSIALEERSFQSPGLAVENIVRIIPYKFLDMSASSNDNLGWPYGKEIEAGYINLNPPFDFWCDHGVINSNKPEWIDGERIPDVLNSVVRSSAPSPEQWEEYESVNSSTKNSELT
jgi:hypothetical protein